MWFRNVVGAIAMKALLWSLQCDQAGLEQVMFERFLKRKVESFLKDKKTDSLLADALSKSKKGTYVC